uniref:YkgJ family cysteine cluster protein n=1 Tax=Parascaris univalens TaxID=6257 RepID=A0A915CK07_PARUN
MPLTCSDCPKICCSVIIPASKKYLKGKKGRRIIDIFRTLDISCIVCFLLTIDEFACRRICGERMQYSSTHQYTSHPIGLYTRTYSRMLHHREVLIDDR